MKFKIVVFVFHVLHYALAVSGPYASCDILLKDFVYKEPLLLQGTGLWKQSSPNLNITGKITLACSGGNNVLSGTDVRAALATCSGTKLQYSGLSMTATNVTCKSVISGDIRTTKQSCANGQGTWSVLGFDLRNGTFIDLYKVCYSQTHADALYSQHRVSGRSIPFKQVETRRPDFKSAGSAPGVSHAVAYKGSTQLETFTRLLGEHQANRYINASSMLARGHLAPDGDFPLVPHQFATYFYVNVCPQWQIVNAGNWLKVENMVRNLAARNKDDLDIFTGVHDVLSLPDYNGNYREIYLAEQKKIAVPKWLWKVVYLQRKKEGIALITLNNPFAQKRPSFLCPNICDESNWIQDTFTVLAKGYTYCCDVNELRKVVPIVPSLNIKSTLLFTDNNSIQNLITSN